MPEVAVLVHAAEVAGVIPAGFQPHGGLLHIVEITLHHIIAPHHYLAGLIRAAMLAGVVVDDLHLHARHRQADAAAAVALRGVDRDQRRGLGGAVTLVDVQLVFLPV